MSLDRIDKQLVDTFFEQQPQPAFWMTPIRGADQEIVDFEYRYCNQEFYAYTGLTPAQVLGNCVSNSPAISNPEQRKKLIGELLDVWTNGHKTKSWLYNPDMGRYYSYTRNRVMGGVLTVLQDRTEEHQMMQQMEAQKRLMDNILQYSSNGISVGEVIRDGVGKVVDERTLIANDAAAKLTGIPKDIYLSKTGGEIDPGFLQSEYFQKSIAALETGEPFITQYFLEPTGRWLEVTVSRMDKDRLIHIFTDVTSIKQAQLALERSTAQLQTIINRTQSGIFTLAPVADAQGQIIDFRFVVVNKALAAYVHQQPETLLGELGSKWFTGYMTNGLFEVFRDTYLNNNVNRFDYHYNEDGIDAWIDMMCTRFDGEVLVTFTDYTPVKQLQLQLEQKVKELSHSNHNLEAFAYAASHDLKEPIRKISFFSERLKHRLVQRQDKEELQWISRVERAALRMGQLVDDLLEYSHVSRGVDHMEDVDLNQKVQDVLDDLELTIREKNAVVEVGPMPVIRGHRRQLQQLFTNLIGNALKYSKEDTAPIIHITSRMVTSSDTGITLPAAHQHTQLHLIEVRDNGIGFEQKDAEMIFNVFTRLHGIGEYKGTGVGLSIARKVVENHKGIIWAEGKQGEGSTFFIALPAASEKA
jgi:signal transduction histidine kinase